MIAHPRLLSGPAIDNRKRPIAGSFIFAVQGSATIAPALGAAIERIRCHGRNANPRLPHVRAGSRLGLITAQLLPSAASAQVTAVAIGGQGFGFTAEEPGGQGMLIPVAAGDGATIDSDGNPNFKPPAEARIRVECNFGFECGAVPSGTIPLPGTLTYSYNGKSTILSGLSVSFPTADSATVTGSLDGAPATVAETSGPQPFPQATADFLNRMGAALGATVVEFAGAIKVAVGTIGPLE